MTADGQADNRRDYTHCEDHKPNLDVSRGNPNYFLFADNHRQFRRPLSQSSFWTVPDEYLTCLIIIQVHAGRVTPGLDFAGVGYDLRVGSRVIESGPGWSGVQ